MDTNTEDTPSSNSSVKQINNRRRNDLTCVICHGPASGYNFAQISCHSCKGKCILKWII
jgi:hypothetical protein